VKGLVYLLSLVSLPIISRLGDRVRERARAHTHTHIIYSFTYHQPCRLGGRTWPDSSPLLILYIISIFVYILEELLLVLW
jgi:hypothetical protein